MICGHFEMDRSIGHPLVSALPHQVLLTAQGEDWIRMLSMMAADEVQSSEPGSAMVVDRIAEALMVRIIRSVLTGGKGGAFFSALTDPPLYRALLAIHGDYATRWTLGALAKRAGMSRSEFARRFRDATGMGAIEYLRRWRMIQANRLLEEMRMTVRRTAQAVGYRSEFAFARAFKRAYGFGPGQARAPRPSPLRPEHRAR